MEVTKLVDQFRQHTPPDEKVAQSYRDIRSECYELAKFITDSTPVSHEQDVAIDKLNEVMFWANAAIARNSND